MTKEKMLAKSHFRKNKGSSIGIFCLMLLASMLMSLAMILFTDTYPTAQEEAERLDGGDGMMYVSSETLKIDDAYLSDLLQGAEKYELEKALYYPLLPLPFGSSEMDNSVKVCRMESMMKKTMARTEIAEEDASITGDYIYLPYQFKTSGGMHVGDDYHISISGENYDLKVKGFLNTVYGGCNNSGLYEICVSDEVYEKMYSKIGDAGESSFVVFELKDDVKMGQFRIRVLNQLKTDDALANVSLQPVSMYLGSRTFMSLIIAGSFLAVTMLVVIVIILMIVNSIGNYVKENMKTIGALKAIGYTSRNIKSSVLMMFLTLALIASVIGIAVSYLLAPSISSLVIAQMGVPYSVSFSLIATIVAFSTVVLLTVLVTLFALRKIKKIEPIVALREGVESHNFKTNHFKLDKSVFGLDASLSMKTMLHNKRQNIITFFVTGFMVFICVIALLMFENFNRKPNLSLMVPEICDGVVTFDKDTWEEGYEFLSSQEGVENIRRYREDSIYVGQEDSLYLMVYVDPTQKANKDVCYKGRLPSHENEVNVSGKFAKQNGYKIGDEITLNLGGREYTYLITGFIQSLNNDGHEAIMSEAAAAHILDLESMPTSFLFDTETDEQIDPILDACEEKFGEKMVVRMNMVKSIEASMITFKGISTLMLVMMCLISALVILLVLFLLIRSLVFSKRKDYGIYKAIGYTSKSLILQTAGSFMPTIILSVILFSVVSYFVANPYMQFIMISFGLMKCTFDIPIPGLVVIGAAMILISFLFAVLQARRIKKVEPYQMLVAE